MPSRMPRTGTCGRRSGWMLLETVMATGLLVVGLGVIASQVQGADESIKQMGLRFRAMMLAEMQWALLDTGQVELTSVDEEEEEDFGPRYPDFGWRLTTEETSLDEMFVLKLEILHLPRESDYERDSFEHEDAEPVLTTYAMRLVPQPLDFGLDFGVPEDELEALSQKLDEIGIEGLDAYSFDPRMLATIPFEEFIEVLPTIADALHIDLTQFMSLLPPDILKAIEESGALGESEGQEDGEGEGARP